MPEAPKIPALVGCRNTDCATEVSHPLDMVRLLKGEAICEGCYDREELGEDTQDWSDLPKVTLEMLCE